MINKILSLLRKRIWRVPLYVPAILLVLIIGGAIYHFATKAPVVHTTVAATRGTVREEVAVVGRVQPTERLELSLQGSGRIAYVGTSEGARVRHGQTLVSLSGDDLNAQLASAQAGLDQQQIRLNQLVEGSRAEDIAVTAASTDASKTSRDNAQRSLAVQLRESYSSVDSTLGANVDQFYANPRTNNATFGVNIVSGSTQYFVTATPTEKARLTSQQAESVRLMGIWRDALGSGDIPDITAATVAATNAIAYTQSYLTDLASVVNANRPSDTGQAAIVDGFKVDVASARSTVNAAAGSLNAADGAYRSASSSYEVANRQFDLKTAPAQNSDVAIQEAVVRGAAAQVALVRANIAKNAVISPVDGVVTLLKAKVGESASPAAPVVTVMADADFEIEAKVPEADIAKIAVDNMARVTLDAYSGETFEARVIYVAPAEVVVDNVATYKVKLQFTKQDKRIKPGMSATMDIATKTHENVLVVPQRAIITKSGKKMVRVPDGKGTKDIEVTIGIRGVDSMTEIVTGLTDGQEVITDSL